MGTRTQEQDLGDWWRTLRAELARSHLSLSGVLVLACSRLDQSLKRLYRDEDGAENLRGFGDRIHQALQDNRITANGRILHVARCLRNGVVHGEYDFASTKCRGPVLPATVDVLSALPVVLRSIAEIEDPEPSDHSEWSAPCSGIAVFNGAATTVSLEHADMLETGARSSSVPERIAALMVAGGVLDGALNDGIRINGTDDEAAFELSLGRKVEYWHDRVYGQGVSEDVRAAVAVRDRHAHRWDALGVRPCEDAVRTMLGLAAIAQERARLLREEAESRRTAKERQALLAYVTPRLTLGVPAPEYREWSRRWSAKIRGTSAASALREAQQEWTIALAGIESRRSQAASQLTELRQRHPATLVTSIRDAFEFERRFTENARHTVGWLITIGGFIAVGALLVHVFRGCSAGHPEVVIDLLVGAFGIVVAGIVAGFALPVLLWCLEIAVWLGTGVVRFSLALVRRLAVADDERKREAKGAGLESELRSLDMQVETLRNVGAPPMRPKAQNSPRSVAPDHAQVPAPAFLSRCVGDPDSPGSLVLVVAGVAAGAACVGALAFTPASPTTMIPCLLPFIAIGVFTAVFLVLRRSG